MNLNDSFFAGLSNPGSTASSLVAGVKALDPESWRRFATIYGPMVYGLARRAGLHAEDSADVTQDVFRMVAAWADRLEHGRTGDTFRGWLFAITRNKLRDHWRRGAGRARASGGSDALEQLLNLPEPDFTSDADAIAKPTTRIANAVELVRAEFEQRSWQAFWRVTVDGRPAAEVASEIGITANAVYVARSRILRRLREVLAQDTSR